MSSVAVVAPSPGWQPFLSSIEKVFEPVASHSGTSSQVTVKVLLVVVKKTEPPVVGLRSSQTPAIRGGPSSISWSLSVKSESPAPKVRLPLALTNTESKSWPQMRKVNGRASCTEPSSPTGRGSPSPGWLKMMSMPVFGLPAATVIGV